MSVPAQWPVGQYDLIVLSDVLYVLSSADLNAVGRCVCRAVTEAGVVLLVNRLGDTDGPLASDQAAEAFITAASPRLRVDLQQPAHFYRLGLLCSRHR